MSRVGDSVSEVVKSTRLLSRFFPLMGVLLGVPSFDVIPLQNATPCAILCQEREYGIGVGDNRAYRYYAVDGFDVMLQSIRRIPSAEG